MSTESRISELLSLTIGDVFQNGAAVTDLLLNKKVVKGGEVSRAVSVNVDGREAIENLISWHWEKYGTIASGRPLFPSRLRLCHCALNVTEPTFCHVHYRVHI